MNHIESVNNIQQLSDCIVVFTLEPIHCDNQFIFPNRPDIYYAIF